MKEIQSAEDVYPAIEEIISELKLAGHSKFAEILEHRMHKVAWTTRSELFDELQSVITQWLESDGNRLASTLKEQIHRVLQVITISE